MIQRRTRDYEVSLWSLQDSLIAILKQYGLEYKGQIENGKLQDRDDGTQTFSFDIPMYYHKDGVKIENPSWYNVKNGNLLINMRKIKVIFNKDNLNRKIYEFLITKVTEEHSDDNSLYCNVECLGLAFHELGKIGYKISLSDQDFYNDDYDWSTNGKWYNVKKQDYDLTQPLATLNYWNDKVFNTINNWDYKICMNWESHSLWLNEKKGVLEDYTPLNDIVITREKRLSGKVYEDEFVDSWHLEDNNLLPTHITSAREKARIAIDIHDSNIYNITQQLAETFGVFCRYEYLYDDNCCIIGRHVIYYNNFLNEEQGIMDIIYPYQTNSIKREMDSTDLVTKLFVKAIEDNSGMLSIIDVGANKSQEDYILNFDYLHSIGGITDEQYKAVQDYIINIRSLNEKLTPISAKVISLQSQLVELLAELTTRKNAIVQDTEQILSNTALLNAITNNTEVLSVPKTNPQTVVLIKDTASEYENSYYIKITQKGVYPETIHIYKSYSYQTSKLSLLITTGVIMFDEAGEVIKISNIFLTELDSKTIYIIYDYRPALFYDRIIAMWLSRLVEDTARQESLSHEIARLKYSLYGDTSELKNVDISNIFDINIYTRYQNLLREKESTIKEFNALMGPALREGYWQPENYNDYGDKYNDRFIIRLDNTIPIEGTTEHSQFRWDDQLFEGLQDLYYEFSAAQYQQAYPCIDLRPHPLILKMMVENVNLPISYVYKPVTANEQNPRPRERPSTSNNNIEELVVIPNLYQWNTNVETDAQVKLSTIYNGNKLKSDYREFVLDKLTNYSGKLKYIINPEMKPQYSYYVWYGKNNNNWVNVTKALSPLSGSNNTENYQMINVNTYKNNIRIVPSNSNTSATLQLLSTSTQTLNNWDIRLVAGNNYGTNIEYDKNNNEINTIPMTHIRNLSSNIVTINSTTSPQLQNIIKDNANSEIICSYLVKNNKVNDMITNRYVWQINSNGTWSSIIEYYELDPIQVKILNTNYANNYVVTRNVTSNGAIHNLRLFNDTNNSFFTNLFQNRDSIQIRLVVKNLQDHLLDTSSVGALFTFYGRTSAPWITALQPNDNINTSVVYSTESVMQFKLIAHSEVVLTSLNNSLALWLIGSENNWTSVATYLNNSNITINTTNTHNANKTSDHLLTITIPTSVTWNTAKNLFDGTKYIRCRVTNGNNNYSSYKQFDRPLKILLPMLINNVTLLTNLLPVMVDLLNYIIKTITLKVKNALQYTWELMLPNSTNVQTLIVNENTVSRNIDEDRYIATFSMDNNNNITTTTLSIRIPALNQLNYLRDDGLKIRCICENFSEQPKIYIPSKQNNIDIYKTLEVYEPITINSITDGKWWPIIHNEPVPISKIQFTIPKVVFKNKNIDNLITNGQINTYINVNKIYLISDPTQNSDIHEYNDSIKTNLTNITYTLDNSNVNFIGDIGFTMFKDIDSLKINNVNIVNTSNTNNNNLYGILGKYSIYYQENLENLNSIIKSKENKFNIIIKQCGPEVDASTNHINSYTNALPTTQSNKRITIDYTETNNTINPPIVIRADSDKIFSLNLASVAEEQSGIVWKCGNVDESTQTLGDISYRYYKWNDNYNTQIICTKSASTLIVIDSTAKICEVNLIGAKSNGKATTINNSMRGVPVGYSEHLYLQVSNPWGIVTSCYFTFNKTN